MDLSPEPPVSKTGTIECSGVWAALDPVAAADPVACSSQSLHSSLGAEGAIVPGEWGGGRAQRGVSPQKEGMRLEKLPQGSSVQVPTRSPAGPLHDPFPH